MAKKTKKLKRVKKTVIILTALIIIILSIPSFFFIYFIDRVYPNAYIAGVNLTGKTSPEVLSLLSSKIKAPLNLTLTKNDKSFNIPVTTLTIALDKQKTLENSIALGRSGNFISDLKTILGLLRKKTNYPLAISIDKSALKNALDEISQKISVLPINAKFQILNSKVQTFSPEINGIKVDKEKLTKEIINEIQKNNGENIQIEVPTQVDYAEIKTSDANNLGITEMIGSGTSHFAGSAQERLHNINLAAQRINNSLVAPNQEFSFDQTVGDISINTGYDQAYIIENGKTVLGDGGGVCQVSTTLFRAALNSGLTITDRTAHAYRVHYYEEDSLPGFDATVYSPVVDLKFKNDTENYILIQTQIDLINEILTFNIYGTKDGREISITKPVLWDYQKAPAPLYTDDPTLPLGVTKQVDFAASGIKSQFEYTVKKNGQVINHQVFYSNFEPWQAKFLRGTKV